MKKTLLFSCIVLSAMVACYKDEALLNEIPQDPLTKAKDYLSGDEYVKMKRHKITTQRAMLIAEEAKTLFADENERQIRSRSVGMTLAPIAITTHSKTRSAGGADTLMYVVNYSNNGGYVFVSNDDRDGEILMYSGGGNFTMQDTAGNAGLKLHVEMMIAYQEHKLKEMKAAEARGEEYMGSMTTETLDMDFAPNDVMPVAMAGGLPGAPGHTCNVTGQSGLPGAMGTPTRKDICAPATYVSKDWEGDVAAIELAQNKYKNQKCFGVPVNPPTVNFMTTGGDHGFIGDGQNIPACASAPYCAPPLWNYDEYYIFYGAKMHMLYKKVEIEHVNIEPLLKTYWHQREPLDYKGKPAGCGPIAMAQIMVYHKTPESYISEYYEGKQFPQLTELEKYATNDALDKVSYKFEANRFVTEIGKRLGVVHTQSGSGVLGLLTGAGVLRDVFDSFGYYAYQSNTWDYQNDSNFPCVANSIINKLPVLIYGFPEGRHGVIKVGKGHIWVLDGYQKIEKRYYYADYYFDEYGKFNAEKRYLDRGTYEYVHGNMGQGEQNLKKNWVLRNVYVFDGDDYCNKLYFITDIKPK